MAITRSAPYTIVTDDDGSGTTGTPWNAAWVQGLLDAVDGRWTVKYVSATGTLNNLATDEADLIVFTGGPGETTVTGLTAPSGPAKPGKPIRLIAGNGLVLLSHNNGSSSAANRLWNKVTTNTTPLGNGTGSATYVYDPTSQVWRLVQHEQGCMIVTAPSWTATGTNPAIGNGTFFGKHYLRGRTVQCVIYLYTGSTTTYGSGVWSFGLPFYATTEAFGSPLIAMPAAMVIAGAQWWTGFALQATTGTIQVIHNGQGGGNISATVPQAWASGSTLVISGFYEAS